MKVLVYPTIPLIGFAEYLIELTVSSNQTGFSQHKINCNGNRDSGKRFLFLLNLASSSALTTLVTGIKYRHTQKKHAI